ncbi:helix-turn-helix domain-containing protein [Aliivibrio fischeri]|uniref:helix-turn-helix transcriptional regulator n=1 Tax=Aliivibrio fischeri TaxID=668 RepID=UPI0012D8E0E0|nr:AraC family transcriptional regulator [Aliivibrio fischeri]MUK39195.1 helix-turn-helix domain-containing protein [Aliivibrio fischeri]MUL04105.1 helix-turn-helix domain-containing protein [Aliivibrio fischeri]MUL06669.1 helix-turn-helix domain-containing protein [Aliivibrio fischeri]
MHYSFINNTENNYYQTIFKKHIRDAYNSQRKLISIYSLNDYSINSDIKNAHIDSPYEYGEIIIINGEQLINEHIKKAEELIQKNKRAVFIINKINSFSKGNIIKIRDFVKKLKSEDHIKFIFPFTDDTVKRGMINILLSDEFYNIYIPHPNYSNAINFNKNQHKNDNSLIKNILSSEENIEKLKTYHSSLYLAISYINKNYSDDITLEDVAKASYVSSSHLSYLFRTKLNTKFKKVLIILRLNKAKELIINDPRLTLTNIAIQVGFYDLSHFGKVYRKYEGVNVGEIRKNTIYNLL